MQRVIAFITGILLVCAVIVFLLPAEERQKYYQGNQEIVGEPSPITVYLAARDLPRGTQLGVDDFREVKWPPHKVPRHRVEDLSNLSEHFARRELSTGMPLVRSDITMQRIELKGDSEKGTFEIVIDSGVHDERKMPLGSRVDIMKPGKKGERQVLARGVRVLAYNTEGVYQQDSPDTKSEKILKSGVTVRIESSPAQLALLKHSRGGPLVIRPERKSRRQRKEG